MPSPPRGPRRTPECRFPGDKGRRGHRALVGFRQSGYRAKRPRRSRRRRPTSSGSASWHSLVAGRLPLATGTATSCCLIWRRPRWRTRTDRAEPRWQTVRAARREGPFHGAARRRRTLADAGSPQTSQARSAEGTGRSRRSQISVKVVAGARQLQKGAREPERHHRLGSDSQYLGMAILPFQHPGNLSQLRPSNDLLKRPEGNVQRFQNLSRLNFRCKQSRCLQPDRGRRVLLPPGPEASRQALSYGNQRKRLWD
jgi:hypothetical protein